MVPRVEQGPIDGWEAFGNVAFMGQLAVVLLLALALSAAIAYHPSARSKAATLEELEQPKTFMMYSMVGAVIAMLVRAEPSMALVVFGIGGLLRFRTNVGYAKDTGRVILVTIVGLCCGMDLYVVAIFATLIGWILVYALERSSVGMVVIQVVDPSRFQAVAAVHRDLLREAGCEVIGEQKRLIKGTVAFIYRAPQGVSQKTLEAAFAELPEDQRAPVDWQRA
ncbi:MAG: MgtC/SapB family protein [Myxococcales bacterium]|nr:MgtC/SapB family protein [Myxococcales bacterium]